MLMQTEDFPESAADFIALDSGPGAFGGDQANAQRGVGRRLQDG